MDSALAQGMEDPCQASATENQTSLTGVSSSCKFTRVKKIITTLHVAFLAIGFAFALTGCDVKKTEPSPMENEPPPDPAKPDIPGEKDE